MNQPENTPPRFTPPDPKNYIGPGGNIRLFEYAEDLAAALNEWAESLYEHMNRSGPQSG